MSNADEDEVEDELEAMEHELSGVKLPDAPRRTVVGPGNMPDTPETTLPGEEEKEGRQKERARARRVALEALW